MSIWILQKHWQDCAKDWQRRVMRLPRGLITRSKGARISTIPSIQIATSRVQGRKGRDVRTARHAEKRPGSDHAFDDIFREIRCVDKRSIVGLAASNISLVTGIAMALTPNGKHFSKIGVHRNRPGGRGACRRAVSAVQLDIGSLAGAVDGQLCGQYTADAWHGHPPHSYPRNA